MMTEDFFNFDFESCGPFWHLCTPGDLSGVLFREVKDFVYGMNLVAHAAAKHPSVDIYTFVLMSNHLHFVLSGTEEDCISFFDFISRRLKRYLAARERISDFKGFACKLFKVNDLQYLRNVIAYVNRNAYVARRSNTPYSYLWGSAYCFYNGLCDRIFSTPLSGFTVRELRSMFFTRNVDLPDTYRFVDGYVFPLSYCKIDLAESLFMSPNHYFNMLSRQVESYAKISRELGDLVTYTDDELFTTIVSLCNKDFNVKKISELDKEQKISLAKKLHFNYNASNKQIKRVLRLDEVVVDALFPMTRKSDR